MEQDITEVVELLSSDDMPELERAVLKLNDILLELLPLIKGIRQSGAMQQHNRLTDFLALQDDFEFNIVSHLIHYYKKCWDAFESIDLEILLLSNKALQGLLLLHPGSRKVFHRRSNMLTLINFLRLPNEGKEEKTLPVKVTISFISTTIHVLLKDLKNVRVFEENEGCTLIIGKLSKSPGVSLPQSNMHQDLNFKIIEFLIFYMTEEHSISSSQEVRSSSEKAELLRPCFAEIDSLMENINSLKNLY